MGFKEKIFSQRNVKYLKTYFIIFIITLAIFLVKYQGYGLGDMNEHMVLAYHEVDGELFKNDWFVNSVEGFDVRKNFSIFINFFNGFVGNYEITSILILFVLMFLCGVGFYHILLLLSGNSLLALFGVVFSTGISKPAIGAHTFDIGTLLLSSRIALVIIVWALYFYLRRNYGLSFFLLGGASLIHISHTYLVYGILMFALVFRLPEEGNKFFSKKELKRKGIDILKSLTFFILFSISLIPLIMGYLGSEGGIDSEKIVYLFKFRGPHHFDPFSWGPTVWILSLIIFAVFIFSFIQSRFEKRQKKVFALFVLGIFLYFIIEFFLVTFFSSSFIIKLHLFRINEFLDIIMSLFIIEFAFNSYKRFRRKICWSEDSKKYLVIISLVIILVLLDLLFIFIVNEKINGLILNRGPLVLGMILMGLIVLVKKVKIKVLLASILGLFLLSYVTLVPVIGRYQYPDANQELYDFIKDNVPKDSVILTPPDEPTFRIGSERAIVVDFKAFPFGEQAMEEWYARILGLTDSNDLAYEPGVKFSAIKDKYYSLNKEEVLSLKSKYDFSYAVFSDDANLDFEEIYKNDKFTLYEVN